ETGPVALRVRQSEARERAVRAAIEHAAVLDRLERLCGCALRCDEQPQGKECGQFLHLISPSARHLPASFADGTRGLFRNGSRGHSWPCRPPSSRQKTTFQPHPESLS